MSAQDFDWVASFQGPAFENANNVTLDGSGNVYTVGRFGGTVDFDPGPGLFELTSTGSQDDGYIWKLDSSGNLVWVAQLASTAFVLPKWLAIDASGNLYVTGTFRGTADFDPGAGVFNLTATANTEAWVLKLDSAGNFVWAVLARSMSGSATIANAVAVNESGTAVYVSGQVSGFGDFDPGPGTTSLNSTGSSSDSFVWKLTGAGNLVWVRQFEDTNYSNALRIALDSNENVYTSGYYRDAVDFDPGPGTFNSPGLGSNDIFVCKLNSLGTFLWARFSGGTGGDEGTSLAVDADDNVYIGGAFSDSATFNLPVAGDQLVAPGSGNYNAFVWKADSTGSFVWANQAGGAGFDAVSGLALDADGNVYSSGYFDLTADFGPIELTSNGGLLDGFIAKMDASGNFQRVEQIGGAGGDQALDVAVSSDNWIHVAGYYENTVDFDPGPGTFHLTSAGSQGDPYVLRLGVATAIQSIVDIGNDQGRSVSVSWSKSAFDAQGATPLATQYELYRRIDALPHQLESAPETNERIRAAQAHGMRSDPSILSAGWHYVGSVPAHGSAEYSVVAPTLTDSTISEGQHWSVFFVRVATDDQFVYYDSQPDSGYSIDNLAPAIPTNLQFVGSNLQWDEAVDGDFQYFTVYGGPTGDFGSATLVGHSVDPTLSLVASPNAWYFVTSTDYSGNESGVSSITSPLSATVNVPRAFALQMAQPNPFSRSTTIHFDVPKPGRVDLEVYDARGRRIHTLVNADVEPGRHTSVWNGMNAHGRAVSPGTYFIRMRAGGLDMSRKVLRIE